MKSIHLLDVRRCLLIGSLLITCGCDTKNRTDSPRMEFEFRSTILTKILAKKEYANAIQEAERDLPSDEWRKEPRVQNFSRVVREIAVAERMLAEIKPSLKRMGIEDLVSSLMVLPLGTFDGFSGVAYYVLRDGNQMIIEEIKTRSEKELALLTKLADENVIVWDGANGSHHSLDFIIHDEILKDKKYRGTSK